ncbi:LLM class flavin-dependent oxidoreductase [Brachybacterium saurashtrense]|uniref:LLM class flavin-dependent oxidoreductase n=1 Tax=Brachybacterium saurashtrense TaxID=556288 RepID=A0A345YLQ8_9MICO|nr:LLM class flavin-dependent oxidoreductase [Brachybacterium saurashtrense]AXK44860.1 LLM class flavin-dependent oxidoreductase [Brachybacterium saurashtrense]RRR20731.1 LLM class flavin-dependent oxidoreductase [Brachybacterium saurashtrense]
MTAHTAFGSAPFALSVLDNAFTGVGQTAHDALQEVVTLAQRAERRGYRRFWMSEHHAMPAASTSAPQMMLAALTRETERIRLGAGGVMLPNHAPLLIAEQFGMLEALAPGRIDLGLGRAPGTDAATAAALRRHHAANDEFPQQVDELIGFLSDDFPDGHPYRHVHAVPGPWQAAQNRVPFPSVGPDLWILGSSPHSAQLAARLGRPYAFALQFGDADITTALRLYRENFRPSVALAEPYVLVSVSAAAHDDAEEARRQATSSAMAMLRMFTRQPFALLPPEEVAQYSPTPQERQVLEAYTNNVLHGTGVEVGAALERLHAATAADELMLVVTGHSREIQARTVDLVADHFAAGSE